MDTYKAQVDADTFLGLLYFLVVTALVLRSLEGIRHWASGLGKRLVQVAILLSAVIAGAALLPVTLSTEIADEIREIKNAQGVPWRVFQADSTKGIITLELARKANQPVFVDFTADWCVNCKTFEKTHIEVDEVINAFRETGVWAAKADYTKKDPSLKKLLKALGRGGLPTYAIYFPMVLSNCYQRDRPSVWRRGLLKPQRKSNSESHFVDNHTCQRPRRLSHPL